MKKRILVEQRLLIISLSTVLSCFLFLLLPGNRVSAQNLLTVGTAVSTTSSSGLSNSTTTGSRNERHTCIYSAAELGAAGLVANNVLIGIAWEKTGAAAYAGNDLTIRIWLKHTAATIFSANPTFGTETSSATLVYETTAGTIPAAAGWLPFNFDVPFTWNGTDAIQVITELVRPVSWTTTGFSWRTMATVTNAAANASAAAASPPATLTRTSTRPQIRLEVATTGNDAALTAMTAPISGVPGTQNIDVTLRNTGSANLTSAAIDWTINGSAPVTYNWSGGLAPGNFTTVTLANQAFALGTNTITATITGANGGADVAPGNNNISRVIETCFPLSGNYTINGSLPVSATNFSSFNDFANKLSSCGINGNVTATVAAGSGPYNEQVTFSSIPGLGATATVTIEGSGATITATTTTQDRHVVRLRNVQYFTINNLKVEADTSAMYFMGIHIMESGHHITVSNCEVNMKTNESTLYGAYVASTNSILEAGAFHDLNFINNKSISGGYGVSVYGISGTPASNIVISGNQFFNVGDNAVYVRETTGALIHGNLFEKNAGAGGVSNGIQLAQTGNVNASIYNNYFKMSQTNGGLRAIYLFGGTGNKVYNNVITDIQSVSGDVTGIQLRAAATAPEVYNNTIAINHTTGTSGDLYGIRIETANTGAILRNNVININQATTGFKAGIMLSSNTNVGTSFNSNNNLFWVPGGQVAGYTNVTTPTPLAANLAAWQGYSQDAGSTEADPLLYSAALPIPTNAAVADLGIPYGGLTTDIQGNARSATAPDFGAYEYSLPLPVLLTRFYGERISGIDKLYWHTAQEDNNRGFEVEQSDDGIAFKSIGFVSSLAAGGNSNHLLTYTFEDKQIRTGVSYYRLKQIDRDGGFSYSTILKLNGSSSDLWNMTLFPNPVSDIAGLTLTAPRPTDAIITITDMKGGVVFKTNMHLIQGTQSIDMNTASLPPGIYFLKITGSMSPLVRKFIKQ